jgi:O-antigen ligase
MKNFCWIVITTTIMAGLFIIKDNLSNKISYYHLLLLMASLPFDRFYSHIILISLIVHTMIQFKKSAAPVFSLQTLVIASVFLVTVFSTVYAASPARAFNEWGKQIFILLFPLLFCFLQLDLKRYRAPLLLAFSLVITATVAYLYVEAFLTLRFYQLPLSSLFSHAFTNHNFSAPIDMHATFFSMQLAIAFLYLVSVLMKGPSLCYKLFLLACIFILAAGLLQLSSKSVCFCLFIIVNLAVPYFLLKGRGRRKYVLAAAALSMIAIVLVFKLGAFRDRFVTQLHSDLSQTSTEEFGDPRLARWKAATELIAKAPVFGYGAGTEIPLLKDIFFERKFYTSYLHQLNAHNQYLSFLLKSGIAGLLVFLLSLVYGFRLSFLRKDLLLFVFILLIAFVSVSENLLDVNKGIIFYAFFFSFFVFSGEAPGREISPLI